MRTQWTNGLGQTGLVDWGGGHDSDFTQPVYGTIGITQPSSTMPPMNQMPGACPWCSTPWSASFHGGRCPKVKAKEYHENGTLKRVEFYPEP